MRIDINEVDRTLDMIDLFNHRECNAVGYQHLLNCCLTIIEIIPFVNTYVNTTITRCRKNDGKIFKLQDDISYNRFSNLVTRGRFNLARQPIFYGSLPTFRNGEYINYGNQGPMFEVCKELKTHESLSFPSFFTIGYWETKVELYAVSLCHDAVHLSENKDLSISIFNFEKEISKKYTSEEFKCVKRVWKYFSELSRKWDKDNINYYSILTAFFTSYIYSIKKKYNRDVDAIIYPSAMTDGKALNIAIIPPKVDEKLSLVAVQMYILRHRGLPYAYQPITEPILVKNGQFCFDEKFEREFNISNFMRNEANA